MSTVHATDDATPHDEMKLQQRLITCLQDPATLAALTAQMSQEPRLKNTREQIARHLTNLFATVVPHLIYDLSLPVDREGVLLLQFNDATDTRSKRVIENSPNYFDTSTGCNRIVVNRWQMLGTRDSDQYKRMPNAAFMPMILSLLDIYTQNVFPQYRDITLAERMVYERRRLNIIPSAAAPAGPRVSVPSSR